MGAYSGVPAPMPGANTGGTNYGFPSPGGGSSPALGTSGSNPLTPGVPTGTAQPGVASPYSGTDTLNPATQGGLNTTYNGPLQSGPNGYGGEGGFIHGAGIAGIPTGLATLLWNFLQGGAGYNQQAAEGIIQSVQPQAQQASANLSEQFSAEGLRNSSPAAYGEASFNAQMQDYYAGIFSQMYEQSVQNYMNVLMGVAGKTPTPPTTTATSQFQGIASGISSLLSGGSYSPTSGNLTLGGG